MLYSQRQPLKIRQNNVTLLFFKVAGSSGTPAAAGDDIRFIKEIQDVGVGQYKIVFKDKAQRNLDIVGHISYTEKALVRQIASDTESVTIHCTDSEDGTDLDSDVGLTVKFHQDKTLY